MQHTTSEIVNNLKESLYNVSQNLMSLANETDFDKVVKVNNEVSDVLASLKELDISITSLTSDQVTAKLTEATNLVNDVQSKLDSGSFKGDKGDKGDQGIQGIQGLKGDKGDKGIQGIQGLKGDKGDQGIQGIQGIKGDNGDFLAQDYNNLTNKPIDVSRVRLDFFRFSSTASDFSVLHLKTNILSTHLMLTFKSIGYAHTGVANIDSTFSAQFYLDGVFAKSISNVNYPLFADSYISTDGYIVLVLNNVRHVSYIISLFSSSSSYHSNLTNAEVTEALFNDDSTQKMF